METFMFTNENIYSIYVQLGSYINKLCMCILTYIHIAKILYKSIEVPSEYFGQLIQNVSSN